MDETSNRIRAVIALAAIASMSIVASCAPSTPAQSAPSYIETEAPSTSTTAPPADLSWLNVTTTTAPETRNTGTPAPQPAPDVVPVEGCFIDLARQIGWPEHTLATLAHIINRESNCDPAAFADRPSTLDNSRGLLQINAWGTLADGIRAKCGVEPEDLFDPAVNLTCGLTYYQTMGFRPWGQ